MRVWLVPPVTDAPRRVEVAAVAPCGSSEAVVSFAEVGDASVAESLVGCHCLVEAGPLENGGVPLSASAPSFGVRAGWRFSDVVSGREGEVVRVEEAAGQVLMTVVLDGEPPSGQGHLVPLADGLVLAEDGVARLVSMACPEGLFDL